MIRSFLKSALPKKWRVALWAFWSRITEGFHRSSARALRLIHYGGWRYTCPFCGGRWRKMLPRGLKHPVIYEKQIVGLGYRENCMCPACGAFNRDRLVYLYLNRQSGFLDRPLRVLHVAPEPALGRYLKGLPHIDYLSGDLDERMAMVKMDVTDIPFPDRSFDLIICSHVLEHVSDDRKALAEFHRVLKPGGRALLMAPISAVLEQTLDDARANTPEQRAKLFGQEDHMRLYGQDFPDRLKKAGFRVDRFHTGSEISEHRIHRYALIRDETLFIGHRDT